MAIATSARSELSSPLAVCIIGGLLLSTLVTLVFIPVLYSFFLKEKQP